MLKGGSDEKCLDLNALFARDFPADRIIKMLNEQVRYGRHIEHLVLSEGEFNELRDYLGAVQQPGVNEIFLYSHSGKTRITK